MKKTDLLIGLFASILSSIGFNAVAEMTIDQSEEMLTVTSDISGTMTVKVIAPNDEIIVNKQNDGSSFSWIPSGVDGAYRYDVRVTPDQSDTGTESTHDYIGGVIEVKYGQMIIPRGE